MFILSSQRVSHHILYPNFMLNPDLYELESKQDEILRYCSKPGLQCFGATGGPSHFCFDVVLGLKRVVGTKLRLGDFH